MRGVPVSFLPGALACAVVAAGLLVAAPRLAEGILLYEAMREAGLAASNGEARRLIKGGGARVNDTAISDEAHKVTSADLGGDGTVKLSAGKKRHAA